MTNYPLFVSINYHRYLAVVVIYEADLNGIDLLLIFQEGSIIDFPDSAVKMPFFLFHQVNFMYTYKHTFNTELKG